MGLPQAGERAWLLKAEPISSGWVSWVSRALLQHPLAVGSWKGIGSMCLSSRTGHYSFHHLMKSNHSQVERNFPFQQEEPRSPTAPGGGHREASGDIRKWPVCLWCHYSQLIFKLLLNRERRRRNGEEDRCARACVSSLPHTDVWVSHGQQFPDNAPWIQAHYSSLW